MGNVLPVFEEVRPDLVVYQPHGRLGEKAVELLKNTTFRFSVRSKSISRTKSI